jgi:hypothetical protein
VPKLSDAAMDALRRQQLDSSNSEDDDAVALAIALVSDRLAGT